MTSLPCNDSVMAERLLQRGRQSNPSLTPEERIHWNRCLPCRIAVRRFRRLSSTWRVLEPTAEELSAACVRFGAKVQARARGRRFLPGTIAFAVVLAAAAASAAVRALSSHLRVHPSLVVAAVAPPGTEAPQARLAVLPTAPLVQRELVAATSSAAVVGPLGTPGHMPRQVSPTRAVRRSSARHGSAPPSAHENPAASVAPLTGPSHEAEAPADLAHLDASGRRQAAPVVTDEAPARGGPQSNTPEVADDRGQAVDSPLARPPTDLSAVPGPATHGPGPSWAAAAAALREGDRRRAEIALGELVAYGDTRTRDAARLARAQLWLAEGRRSEARAEFANLGANGATPFIRERARSELDASR